MLSGNTKEHCLESCLCVHHNHQGQNNNSGETAWKGYLHIDDCIRPFCPEHLHTKKQHEHKCNEYCIHGVNVLNKAHKDVNHLKAKIQERKVQHTKVEKRRRTLINQYIEELSTLLPPDLLTKSSKTPRGLILQKTVQYIKQLKNEKSQ